MKSRLWIILDTDRRSVAVRARWWQDQDRQRGCIAKKGKIGGCRKIAIVAGFARIPPVSGNPAEFLQIQLPLWIPSRPSLPPLKPGLTRDQYRGYSRTRGFLRLAVPRMHSLVSLPGGRVRRQGRELVTRYLRPGISEERTGFSQVPGEPRLSVCTCSNPTPAGLLAPDHCGAAAWPLVIERQRLPRLGLSTLNSMASGLAVYASQCGLLQHHARLASGCWSGSTKRAFHPQDSDERFQDCIPTSLSSSPKLCLAQWGRPTCAANKQFDPSVDVINARRSLLAMRDQGRPGPLLPRPASFSRIALL